MRFYRRQRSLWRAAVLSALNVLILVAVQGAGETGASEDKAPEVTYIIKRPSDNRPEGLPIVAIIEASGTVYLDGIPVGASELRRNFEEAIDTTDATHVSLEAEPNTPSSLISDVLAAATLAGAKSIAIVTKIDGAEQ